MKSGSKRSMAQQQQAVWRISENGGSLRGARIGINSERHRVKASAENKTSAASAA